MKLPLCDAVISNFPYIRQELIEKTNKGYKKILASALARDWLRDYPELFEMKAKVRRDYEKAKRNGLDLTPFYNKVDVKLSGQADIYAYLFLHAAAHLKEGARIGVLTSNAWLDVEYGKEIQKFLLDHFRIIAIFESRCEPWFEQSAVNTVVTILERCSHPAARDQHPVKFVKIKKKLAELIPHDPHRQHRERWQNLESLVAAMQQLGIQPDTSKRLRTPRLELYTYEDNNFRIRFKPQGSLARELRRSGQTSKWGQYLRAPDGYLKLQRDCTTGFVPLRFVARVEAGCYSGVNKFFYLTQETVNQWPIEPEYLVPIIKSPKETPRIPIDPKSCKLRVFLCRRSKEELKKLGHNGALRYIAWGEKQVTRQKGKVRGGIPWSKVPSVKNRQPGWWAIPEIKPTTVFMIYGINDRYIHWHSVTPLISDRRMHMVYPLKGTDPKLLCALLNASLTSLQIEVTGRFNLGEGALDFATQDAYETLIPNPSRIKSKDQKKILRAFHQLSQRPIRSVFEEVQLEDRRAFDSAVLCALGVDPDKHLSPLYQALTELVNERISLAKSRKTSLAARVTRDVDKVYSNVLEEIVELGLKTFPDAFVLASTPFKEIAIPSDILSVGDHFMGRVDVYSESGFRHECNSLDEAKYLIYAQKPGTYLVRLPIDPKILAGAVKDYEKYLDELRHKAYSAFLDRVLDHSQADNLTSRLWSELGLPHVS